MKNLDDITYWSNVLAVTGLLISLLAVLMLSFNKYPSSRRLAGYLMSVMVLVISVQFDSLWDYLALLTATSTFTLYGYVEAFFTQNKRLNYRLFIPLGLVLILTLLPSSPILAVMLRLTPVALGFIYGYITIGLINSECKLRGISFFGNPGKRLIWFRNFLYVNAAFMVTWIILLAFNWQNTVVVTGELLIITGFIYFQVFRESTFLSPIPLANKYQKSTLSQGQKFGIATRLDQFLTHEKGYLNGELSLSSLAEELKTSTHHLSQVINETKGMGFQEMIARLRIREAKRLLKDSEHQQTKIEGIAAMVGYNSKSAFNNSFKKFTGLTPSQFKASKDVLTYREARLPDQKKPFSERTTIDLSHVSRLNHFQVMLVNFFKIFLRNTRKNLTFSAINLFGLTVGFTACLFIYLFISDELSYDRHLPDHEQIHRIIWRSSNPQTRTPHPMAQAMVRDLPEVEAATTLSPWYGAGLSKQTIRVRHVDSNQLYEEPDFYFVDSTFLDVFQLKVLAGDPDALRKPFNIVISSQLAEKYFGDENPIGRELTVNDMPVAIAAVIESMDRNSHFHFNAMLSYVTLKSINPDNPWMQWGDFGHFNYIKLAPTANYKTLEARIPDWVASYLNWSEDRLEALLNGEDRFELQPVSTIHLHSHVRWELENNGNILYIYILSGTLVFLLLIVVINYVNLTTARSFERAKEIGIRKTLGALKSSLSTQFYVESAIFCFIALLLALVVTSILLPGFSNLTGKNITGDMIWNAPTLSIFTGVCLLVAVFAGFYPASTLTAFAPTAILKGKMSSSFHGTRMRSALVVVQFFVSAIMIVSSLIVLRQIDYMKTKDLGFDQDAVLAIKIYPSVEIGSIDTRMVKGLQEGFNSLSGVTHTSAISNLPGGQFNQHSVFADVNPDQQIDISEMTVDYNFDQTLDIALVSGRAFNPTHQLDSAGRTVIVNESFVRQLNLDTPVGQTISWTGNDHPTKSRVQIIGVVEDFHYRSLHEEIQPLAIQYSKQDISHLIVKMKGEQFQQSLAQMQTIYETFEQQLPFEYSFLDDQLQQLYQQEITTLNVFSIFAGLALLLAGLGLLGMAIAIMNQKVKEVGIRKILGASISQIVLLVVGQFSKLILIALAIGLPTGLLLMQSWLSEFTYRVAPGWVPFVVAAILLFAVAAASVSFVVIRIAHANPVDAVRDE